MGEIHRSSGDLAAAEQSYSEAIDLARSLGIPSDVAIWSCNLAMVLAATDRLAEARAALAKGLSFTTASDGYKGHAGIVMLDLAAALASSFGEHRTGARFYGAAVQLMRESQSCRQPVDEAFIAPRIAQSRVVLGENAFEAAQRQGAVLGYDAAIVELDRWLQARKESIAG